MQGKAGRNIPAFIVEQDGIRVGSLDYLAGEKQYQLKQREPIVWSEISHCQMCNGQIEDRCWSRSIYCKKCRRLSTAELRERCRQLYEEVRKLKEEKEGLGK